VLQEAHPEHRMDVGVLVVGVLAVPSSSDKGQHATSEDSDGTHKHAGGWG